MKANNRRKVFGDAVDLLMEDIEKKTMRLKSSAVIWQGVKRKKQGVVISWQGVKTKKQGVQGKRQ